MNQNHERQSSKSLSPVTIENQTNENNLSANNSAREQVRLINTGESLDSVIQSMRQPQTLQDLLKISTQLQSPNDNEAATEGMNEERAEFLRNALNSMSVDLVGDIQKRIEILKEMQGKPEEANLTKYEETLEQLVEYLYEIDLSQIFYQLNGLSVIAHLLHSKHATLRTLTANIILECCKNNPYCQKQSVTDDVFGALMEMASKDPNKDAMFKAIAAISAIIRDNPDGIAQFNKYNGIQMTEKALNSGVEKIVNKTIFLIMALCDTDSAIKKKLTECGIIQALVTLLMLSDNIVKEYLLRALLSTTRNNPEAKEICDKNNLKNYLRNLSEPDDGEGSTLELQECAAELYKQLFGEGPSEENT